MTTIIHPTRHRSMPPKAPTAQDVTSSSVTTPPPTSRRYTAPISIKPPVIRSRTKSIFATVRKTFFSSTSVTPEAEVTEQSKNFAKEMRRLSATREKLEMERKRRSDYSIASGYFSPINGKKRIANDTRSRNSMHSRSSYTPLDFSSADILPLPAIRLDGPLEEIIRSILPLDLYMQFGFCMGHPKYFPGDSSSTTTMPWPTYSAAKSSEQHFEAKPAPGSDILPEATLKAATLNGIIHTLSCEGTTDNSLLSDFLRTYHYCVSGYDLIRMVFARYINCRLIKSKINGKEDRRSTEWDSIIQLKLLNIIKKWIHHYQMVLSRNPDLYSFIHGVLEFIEREEANRGQFVQSILADLESRPPVNTSAAYEPASTLAGLSDVLNFEVLRPTALQLRFTDLDPKVIAQQLTLMEHKLFCSIQPEEIYHQAWNDRLHREHTSPNLWSLIQIFNRVAHFITQEIKNSESLPDRVGIIGHAVRVAVLCVKNSNYNSAFEILAGLNMSRIKLVWQALPSRTKRGYHKLSHILSTRDNYKVYRDLIRRQQPPTRPALPFVGVVLTDLVFAENGNPTYFLPSSGHPSYSSWFYPSPSVHYINVAKLRLMSSIMAQLLSYQLIPYHFEESTSVQSWILQVMLAEPPHLDD